MKGYPVPDTDHILRYIGGTHIDNDVITGSGFLAKPNEASPSVNWLETFSLPLDHQIDEVRRHRRIHYGATARLARLNVGAVRKRVQDCDPYGGRVATVHDPLDPGPPEFPLDDPSHALMEGIPQIDTPQGEAMADLIAECILDSFPAGKQARATDLVWQGVSTNDRQKSWSVHSRGTTGAASSASRPRAPSSRTRRAPRACASRARFNRHQPHDTMGFQPQSAQFEMAASMRRREFATTIGGLIASPLAARAQQAGKIYRLGLLAPYSADVFRSRDQELRAQLRLKGYDPGRNPVIETRLASDDLARLPRLAEELVEADVDLIVAFATPAAHAARSATARIPIVLSGIADPLATGLVSSLSRPGGNITGASTNLVDLVGKTLELAAEMIPELRRVTFLSHSGDPAARRFIEEATRAGSALRLRLSEQSVAALEQIEDAVRRAADGGAQALVVQPIIAIQHGEETARAALRHGLPSVAGWRTYAASGGLACYGPTGTETPRIIADIIDKIFKGAKPGDVPIQQTTRFILNVNLRTARMLGLTIPPSILGRADEVIE